MPDDLRLKFAQCQPITAGLPHPPMMLNPISILPHTNLPQNLPLVQHEPPQNFSIKDPHLLKPPQVLGVGEYPEIFIFLNFFKKYFERHQLFFLGPLILLFLNFW